jgi:hypothetical protein
VIGSIKAELVGFYKENPDMDPSRQPNDYDENWGEEEEIETKRGKLE